MNKKIDFKNFRLQSTLSRTANNIMTLHPVKKEWRIAIISLIIIKALTMGFSLFGGWNFFNIIFYNLFNDLQFNGFNVNTIINSFALITLFSIELLTAVFLQKMFKFFFRHRFLPAFASTLVVAFFYTVSFISSTNGLAKRQANKTDKKEIITEDFAIKTNNAISYFQSENKRINRQINRIENNPQGWSEGKRTYLTINQLANISSLQDELKQAKSTLKKNKKSINKQKSAYLSINNTNTEKSAKDFYQIMAIIMTVQFFCTGILNLLWFLIRTQESKDAIVSEDLKEISNTVAEHAETLIMNTLVNTSNRIHHSISDRIQQNEYVDAQTQQLEQKNIYTNKKSAQKNTHVIGFNTDNNNNKNSVSSKRIDTPDNTKLQYLKKHTIIVKAILKTVPETQTHISNSEIKHIQSIATDASHKSNTLIRGVFDIVHATGYEIVNNILF